MELPVKYSHTSKKMRTIFCSLLFLFFALIPSSILAELIDITETTGGFVASDQNYVDFGPAINQATLYEDPIFGLTYLSNDPFLGDTGIYVPSDALTLSFDLEFSTSGSDNFEVAVLDSSGGQPFFDFFHDGTIFGPGTFNYNDVTVDLIALGLLDQTIGLDFNLTYNFDDTTFDAMLSISNINISQSAAPVPEPATMLLLGTGIAGLIGTRIRKKR